MAEMCSWSAMTCSASDRSESNNARVACSIAAAASPHISATCARISSNCWWYAVRTGSTYPRQPGSNWVVERSSTRRADRLDRQVAQPGRRVDRDDRVLRRNGRKALVGLALRGTLIHLALVGPQRRRALGLRGDRKRRVDTE